ncbi:MAG: PKD domain-containing protein [Candidatus Bathyarchaeia archaeon]
MSKTQNVAKLLMLMLITSTILLVSTSPSNASPATTLKIEPEKIIDVSLTPGSKIVINVSVIDVIDLFTWQVKILFKPTVLNCIGATYPPYHIFAGKTFSSVSPIIDNVAGYVLFAASLIGDQKVSGSGVLCQINFTVVGRGISHLNFSRPYGEDTFLLNYDLDTIPAQVKDGYFENAAPPVAYFEYTPKSPAINELITFNASKSYDPDGTIVKYEWNFGDGGTATGKVVTHKYTAAGTYTVSLRVTDNDGLTDTETKDITVYEYKPARMFVNPPEITDPTLLPPSIVKINITVEGVRDMYGYEFQLNYNTEMLTCLGALINIIQNQTHFTSKMTIDDAAGYIWVKVTYYPPSTPITATKPEDLATIYFLISDMGYSLLHLNNTLITDVNGVPISHQTEDGFIMTVIRDVAIIEVTPSRSWIYQNWTLEISVVVANLGNLSESFTVGVYFNETLIVTFPVINLAPNTTFSTIIKWNTTGVNEGIYIIKAEASPVPYEYNVTNNLLCSDPVVVLTKIRDVGINSVNLSRSWAFPGMPVNITVSIENFGEYSESFSVTIYGNQTIIATCPITNMPPKAQINLTFAWNTTGLKPCNTFIIKAEISTIQYEYNLTNNILIDGAIKIRVLGDVNGDGQVEARDIAIVGKAFGSYPGHPRWNPEADITSEKYLVPDNYVDVRDLAMVCKNFGKKC